MDITAPVLARLDAHETLLARQAAALEQQLAELTAHLHEITRKREDLRITRKTLTELDTDVPVPPQTPTPHELLPDNPAYGEILDALRAAASPLRARAVCEALDLGTSATTVNGMRHKLKRMLERGVLAEPEVGLFAIRRTAGPAATDTSS
jgi:uncharacterized coiled-coil protein SlyX